MVDVLEGVEEEAEAVPLVLAPEDGALDVVRRLDQPNRQAVAIQVSGGTRCAQLQHRTPLGEVERLLAGNPALGALRLGR